MTDISVRQVLWPGARTVEEARDATRLPRPASAREVLGKYAEPVVVDELLHPPGDPALGGEQHITLYPDGRIRYTGHMRATGFPSYDWSVVTTFGEADSRYILSRHGRCHGTTEAGDRQSSWDYNGRNGGVAVNFAAIKRAGGHTTDISTDADYFGDVGDVAAIVAGVLAAAYTGGIVGVGLVVGVALADDAGVWSDAGPFGVAGVIVAGTVLLIGGQGAAVVALVAGAVAGTSAALAFEHRGLTSDEIAHANRVFNGTIDWSRVVLTNAVGVGGRPFTMPALGDTVLVNLGEGYHDPVNYDGFGMPGTVGMQSPGQLFIHELTHAWQVNRSTFLPGLVCGGLANQTRYTFGENVYLYGPPTTPWEDLNLEQQASVVDGWYARAVAGRLPPPQEPVPADPYEGYVHGHIQAGVG